MLYKELEKNREDILENEFCMQSDAPTLPIADCPSYSPVCIIGICTQGSVKIRMYSQEYSIHPNEVFIFMPGLLVSLVEVSPSFTANYFTLSNTFFYDVIKTIRSFSPQFFSYMKSHFLYPLPEQEMQYFMNYYTLLKSRYRLHQKFSREAIIALLRILFLDLYNDFESYIHHRNNTSTTRKEELTHKFYTLMMNNYREHKDVIFYADKLHVSSKYLSEVVKETSGKSPKDWIIDYSLLEIKELLKNSSLNIQEITIRTKFLNQSALGRFFKRHTHMSPSEYRESTY